jgi:dipeptidyl aminopeptidase/acylaminoacyl peptidase
MRARVVVIVLIVIAAGLAAQPSFSTERLRVAGPAGPMGGTLTRPASARRSPAVVTLTGSGAHFRDGNRTDNDAYRPFRDIANRLASCGVATLRLDDRGVGESAGNANAATAEDTKADAEAALRYLRSRSDIDPARLGVIGHSYGAVIAPMVAADDPGLGAVILLGGPAKNFRETMRFQWRYRIEQDPAIAPGDRADALTQAMRQQEVNVAASTEAWRRSIQDLDPLAAARRLRMPVLILQGLTDRAVPPEDARALEHAIRESGNTRVRLQLFPAINHHFNVDPVGATDAYARLPSQAVAPVVLDTMCSWLSEMWGTPR